MERQSSKGILYKGCTKKSSKIVHMKTTAIKFHFSNVACPDFKLCRISGVFQ